MTSAKNAETLTQVRLRTQTGRPLGSDGFLNNVESLLGWRVRALPEGRHKNWRKKDGAEPQGGPE